MGTRSGAIRIAHSCQTDSRSAAREFHANLEGGDDALVVFFCSSEYDLDVLAEETNRLFGNTPVVGCTTAGEIGPGGYLNHSLTGVGFPADAFTAVTGRIDNLQEFELNRGQSFAEDLLNRLHDAVPTADSSNTFALLLIDGLSVREEAVARTLQMTLGNIAMLGGSAGDDQRFARTWVFHEGAFHTDAAVLVLANTTLPFTVFKTQHFVRDNERLVVTEADAARRIVKEINGLPAAEEYARVVGVAPGDLDSRHFAAFPIVVIMDGIDYVRAIQKANPDGSLTFFCAIDEGLVLRIARGKDLLRNLQDTFDALRAEIGPPQLVLGCDCILRNVELAQAGLKDKAAEIFRRNRTIGFSTYGEQFRGVHVNQTFTGLAIGGGGDESHE